MSGVPVIADGSTSSPAPQGAKPQRVLACLSCQQRKVKCNRRFPCTNCVKNRTQCIQATLATRKRRRKYPENVLMERLRKYEDILRQNDIEFDALPKEPSEQTRPNDVRGDDESDDGSMKSSTMDWSSAATTSKSDRVFETKYVYHLLYKQELTNFILQKLLASLESWGMTAVSVLLSQLMFNVGARI